MLSARLTQALLFVIAAALCVIAVRPYVQPATVAAQTVGNGDPMYVEPGIYTLRVPNGGQTMGKVMINLRTGAAWGFPTNNADPYPVNPLDGTPQVSHPISLGRFALGEAR